MDGFYVAFVAVGVGLFWLSIRRRDSLPGSLLAGWVFLGVSLAIAPVAFAALGCLARTIRICPLPFSSRS